MERDVFVGVWVSVLFVSRWCGNVIEGIVLLVMWWVSVMVVLVLIL